jgi:hypothetical protein
VCSNDIVVPSENAVYQTARCWWLFSPHSPGRKHKAFSNRRSFKISNLVQGTLRLASHVDVSDASKMVYYGLSYKGDESKERVRRDGETKVDDAEQHATPTFAECAEYCQSARLLLECVRFASLSSDFLLDIVKFDATFVGLASDRMPTASAHRVRQIVAATKAEDTLTMVKRFGKVVDSPVHLLYDPDAADPTDSVEQRRRDTLLGLEGAKVRKSVDQMVLEALEFHACSANRRRLLPAAKAMVEPRSSLADSKTSSGSTLFVTWSLDGVKDLVEGIYVFSPCFAIDGYMFRLQAGRIHWNRSDAEPALGVFLSLDRTATGTSALL